MIRLLYAFLFVFFLPLVLLKYVIRSRKNPDYLHHLEERLAVKLPKFGTKNTVHIHLVSVGEANAASTLINRLVQHYPSHQFLLTVTTPTGRRRVKDLFSQYEQVTIRYLPFDVSVFMERFLRVVKPKVSIILETEMWPYFLLYAKRKNVPVVLVNARLSKKSLKGYLRMPKTSRDMFTSLNLILAQYRGDAKRLIKLGCESEKVKTLGNIKFDLELPDDDIRKGRQLKSAINRPIWIAASTHDGEEEQILAVHKQVLQTQPNTLLILVPRHKERFEDVTQLCQTQFQTVTRSSNQSITPNTQVMVGDTIGEMFFYLALADLTFIGGSLIERGGHNPIEPASLGLPIITGPHVFNFKAVFKQCIEKKFCLMVNNEDQLFEKVSKLFDDKSQRAFMAKKGQKFVEQNKGVVEKVSKTLEAYL